MKYLFKQRLAKIFLLVLLYSSFAFTQQLPISYIKYQGKFREIVTNIVAFVVKEDYYNEELFKKLENPPYFPTYSIVVVEDDYLKKYYEENRIIRLYINGDVKEINVLDHYLKFEKEEFVDSVFPSGVMKGGFPDRLPNIEGHAFQNGQPLTNHIVNLFFTVPLFPYGPTDTLFYCYTSITDENGNYIFMNILNHGFEYALSFKIGDNRYNTPIFYLLEENKVISFNDGIIIGINKPKDISSNYSLLQNYPNPFNPSTNFRYSVPNKMDVRIAVYDLFGREITILVNESKEAGTYNITWNGTDNNNRQVATGVYFYKMQAGGFQKTMKMMLMK